MVGYAQNWLPLRQTAPRWTRRAQRSRVDTSLFVRIADDVGRRIRPLITQKRTESLLPRIELSKETQYAIIALTQLNFGPHTPRTILSDITQNEALPAMFMRTVMRTLANRGLVISKAGPHGGYWLARPAKEISIQDVVEACDGIMKYQWDCLPPEPAKTLVQVLDNATADAATTLRNVSLADLMDGPPDAAIATDKLS
jgi:Rrf2 family protein